MTDSTPHHGAPAHSAQRQQAALSRFAAFFHELEETFLEREDVLNQLALALLAREHVLITGPPGTGKSRLASSVVARIVHADSGEPSLFAKQFTESTVHTELIGPVDFRTLTETGRTEHFTDEGMLGAVHAFLDEVLDGRDMLLRSTLNILEERELKQGTRITPGLIECAVMTSNRYLTEVLEDSRQNLLAFVDRIAFVAFVPRGFADAAHLERIVVATLGEGIQLGARLTVEDVDVLQAMVECVRVPPGVVSRVVALTQDFEERVAQLERSDPSFTATRYFSTRAVARLARLLKAIVLLDKATRRPERPLVAEIGDLGMLRLAVMLAGPRPEDIGPLLERETDPRERRQLQIMSSELELFRACLRALPADEGELDSAPATHEAEPDDAPRSEEGVASPDAGAPAPPPERGPTAEGRLSQAVTALARHPGDFDVIEAVLAAASGLEDERPNGARAARSARGHALMALGELVRFASPASYKPTIEAVARHLDTLERASAVRETLLAAEVSGIDRAAESAGFAAALARLVEHAATVFDRMAHDVVQGPLSSGGVPRLEDLLDALRPTLDELRRIDARLMALGAPCDPPPSDVILGRRIAPTLRASYAAADAPDRARVAELVDRTLDHLASLGLSGAVPVADHLAWVADALARGDAGSPDANVPPNLEGYRALRTEEVRTPMAYAIAELVTTLHERSGLPWEPSLESMAESVSSLPESLRGRLASIDLARVERSVAQLEAWQQTQPARPDPALLEVALEEGALVRFALECRLVRALFPEQSPRAEAAAGRLEALGEALRDRVQAVQREATESRWAELTEA